MRDGRDALKEKGLSKNDALLTISTAYKADTQQLVARFKDNGTGIKDEVISKIFDPFYTTKGFGMGTGLGLNLSYLIVEAHDGWIKVNSKYGKGTTFTVFISANIPENRKGLKQQINA